MLERSISRRMFLAGLGAVAALPVLAACEPQVVEVEKEVTREVEVEKVVKETVVVEKAMMGEPMNVQEAGMDIPADTEIRFPSWSVRNFGFYSDIIKERTGVDAKLESYPGDFSAKLLSEIAAGVGPDMMIIDAYWYGDIFRKGILEPFEPYFKAFGLDRSRFADDPWKDSVYEGTLYGLSLFPGMEMGVFVNWDLASAEGVGDGMPVWGEENFDMWTYADMLSWARESKKESGGQVEHYGWDPGIRGTGFGDNHTFAVYQNLGEFFEDPWSFSSTKCTLASDGVVEALQPFIDGVADEILPDQATVQAVAGGLFKAQRIIAQSVHCNPGVFRELRGELDMRIMLMPYHKKPGHINFSNLLTVNKDSKKKDAAASWIISFTTDDEVNQKKLTGDTTWFVPLWDSLKYVENMEDGFAKDISLASLARIDGMSTKPMLAAQDRVHVFPRHYGGKGRFFQQTAGAAIDAAQGGKMTLKDSFTEAENTVNAELAKGFN